MSHPNTLSMCMICIQTWFEYQRVVPNSPPLKWWWVYHTNFVSELNESCMAQWLGQAINYVINGMDIGNNNFTLEHLVFNIMIVNFNMLSPGIHKWIRRKCFGTQVIHHNIGFLSNGSLSSASSDFFQATSAGKTTSALCFDSVFDLDTTFCFPNNLVKFEWVGGLMCKQWLRVPWRYLEILLMSCQWSRVSELIYSLSLFTKNVMTSLVWIKY